MSKCPIYDESGFSSGASIAAETNACQLAAMPYDELLHHAQQIKSAAVAVLEDAKAFAVARLSYQCVQAELVAKLEQALSAADGGGL